MGFDRYFFPEVDASLKEECMAEVRPSTRRSGSNRDEKRNPEESHVLEVADALRNGGSARTSTQQTSRRKQIPRGEQDRHSVSAGLSSERGERSAWERRGTAERRGSYPDAVGILDRLPPHHRHSRLSVAPVR